MNAPIDPSSPSPFTAEYRTHRNLPALAGLCTMAEANRPGLSVEESVRRLKRHHYALRRIHGILTARITSEPIYELKMAWSHQAWICAEQVSAIRARVGEMREPPLGLDKVPHEGLALAFNELMAAPRDLLLMGLYEIVVPALLRCMAKHAADTHPLADQPTIRLLRIARMDLEDLQQYGRKAVSSLVSGEERAAAQTALAVLNQALAAAGGLDGTSTEGTGLPLPEKLHSAKPWKYDPKPQRDERFPDPYNMGVNAEVFLYDPKQPAEAKVLMMYYKRLREIDVPEMMASIITETPDKPWGYYRDMSRQLWDEARHAMMGEVGFASAGIDWPKQVAVNFTWSLGLNTQLTPKERHAVLYFIEQGLMPKTGKRHEWETAIMARSPLAATFQDFDWADEVLHARVGRDWYVSDMPSPHEAVAYGDACWSKVLMNWERWRTDGFTQHANWWTGAYAQYCERHGKTPDHTAAQFAISYESIRADLKDLALASG
ncbi:MAG: hypothetical protein QE510_08600 [Verrucomicrobiota bacterium]|jgi:hypothetical protein|nr:hypothetical protein [Verrucomicrobiota bacterium]